METAGTTTQQSAPAPAGRALVFVVAVILAGLAVIASSALILLTQGITPMWFALLALTFVTGWATLRIPAITLSFSISDTFSIIAALILGPAAGALTAAFDGLVLSWRMVHTRRSLHRVLFNMAAPAIATWIAAHAYFAIAGGAGGPVGFRRLVGLVAFCLLTFGLNTGIVAIAFSFERRQPIARVWQQHLSSLWVTYFAGIYAAGLIMVLSDATLLELVMLIAPLPPILYALFQHALGRAQDQVNHLANLNRVYIATIEGLAGAIDAKDDVTHDHTRRVQDRSVRLARALGVEDDAEIQAIKAASLLHDVGKIAIPDHILNKPGRLSEPEFRIMKRHAVIGAEMLAGIGFPYPVVPIVRHHHEHWDGRGYPDALAGESIPIGARVLAVVDCFDALTSDRPYRPRLDDAAALEILSQRKGNMYDPTVVDAFFDLISTERRDNPASEDRPASAAPVDPHSQAAAPADQPADSAAALQAVFDLTGAVERCKSAGELGEALWTYFRCQIPASAFVMFAYDRDADAIVPAFIGGDGINDRHSMRMNLGERLSGWVAATRDTILNSDARLDFAGEVHDEQPLQSALAVPIISEGETAGVLTFYARHPGAFADTHRELATGAAYVIARGGVALLGHAATPLVV